MSIHWGQAIIFFLLGTFVGPWVLSMVTGKGKTASAGY